MCLPVLEVFLECLSWNSAQLCQWIFFNILDRLKSSFFNRDFIVVKRKKSAATRSGEYGGCGMNVAASFVRKSHYWRERMCQSVGIMEWFFPPSQIRSLSPHGLSQPFHHILSLSSGQDVEIHDKLCPHNQKAESASLSHWTELDVFVWVWVTFWYPMRILHFCFDNIAVYPSFITCDDILYEDFVSICTVDRLFTDINTSLFLIFLQQAQHKFGCNTRHAQIFPWESHDMCFWYSNFLCYFTNIKWRLEWFTFQTFGMFSSFSDVEGCPERSLSTEVQSSLKCLYHSWMCSTHGFIPKRLF